MPDWTCLLGLSTVHTVHRPSSLLLEEGPGRLGHLGRGLAGVGVGAGAQGQQLVQAHLGGRGHWQTQCEDQFSSVHTTIALFSWLTLLEQWLWAPLMLQGQGMGLGEQEQEQE